MAKTELIPLEKRLDMIDRVVRENDIRLHGGDGVPSVRRGLTIARAMKLLRELVDAEVMKDIMQLCESPLGFRTDRDGKNSPYPVEVVKDCVIECLLRGGSIVGNEFNIIAGRCYLTKEFYERQVRGLVDHLRVIPHVPEVKPAGALVPMEASWLYEGQRDELKCLQTEEGDKRIPVRVNAGMGMDAILGKAMRKLYARIYARVTGSSWADDEPLEEEEVDEEQEEHEEETEYLPDDGDSGVLRGIQTALEACDQLTEVDHFERHAMGLARGEGEEVAVRQWCEWRRDQIRDGRGERSNGRQ